MLNHRRLARAAFWHADDGRADIVGVGLSIDGNTLATEYSSVAQRGGGLGVLNGTIALSTMAGPLLGGALADRWGLGIIPWVAFWFLASALVGAVTLFRSNGRNGD